ncbi:MAG: carbohydrate ABC transporter permease [Lachnospiraceae bacterium]|nr:carbohydrate ABC transporter permease [Lachnospiraceae bacterium]MBQ6875849.1 carbohydrate ABC transporter permease [Lachnospiraceae bacterium]
MASIQGKKMNPTRFHKSQLKFYAILIPMAVVMGLPIIYIFSQALKPLDELFIYPPKFFAQKPSLDNFKKLIESMLGSEVPIYRYFFNSILSTLLTVICTIFITAFAGYALSKKDFKAKGLIFEINTAALMFVGAAVKIPKYLVIYYSGLIDNFWVHIIPGLAMPVGLFLVKQFMDQIPDALIEAARIDGAKDFQIFMKVIMPLSKSSLATVVILTFQAAWNAIEASELYLNADNMKTFAYYMTTLTTTGNDVVGIGQAAAATLIMFIPNLVIFIFMQKNVMSTMAHSGIK